MQPGPMKVWAEANDALRAFAVGSQRPVGAASNRKAHRPEGGWALVSAVPIPVLPAH